MLVYFAMDVLIAAADIHERVKQMAHEIHRDHPDGVHLVCVLKGAFIFLSDLARHLPSTTSLDFMAGTRIHKPVSHASQNKKSPRLGRSVIASSLPPHFRLVATR